MRALLTARLFLNWVLWTLLAGVLLSVAFMYSRDITLNGVRFVDYDIYYKMIQNREFKDIKEFENAFMIVTRNSYPLFPLALVDENKCVENVNEYYRKKRNLSICSDIGDSKKLQKVIQNSRIVRYEKYDILKYQNKNLIVRKVRDKIWFIGEIKKYDIKFGRGYFLKFIMADGKYWFTTARGIKKTLKQTHVLWIVLFVISLLMFAIYMAVQTKNRNRLDKLDKSKRELTEKWEALNTRIHELLAKKYDMIESIKKTDDKELSTSVKSSIDEIDKEIEREINKIKKLEDREKKLLKKERKKIKKLTLFEKDSRIDEQKREIDSLKMLWRYGPTWLERKDIERIATTKEKHLPLVTTQAFIIFEKTVEELAMQIDVDAKYLKLVDQINLIFEKGQLPPEHLGLFHDIRRARNQWFHSGEYPDPDTLNKLLKVLHASGQKPII